MGYDASNIWRIWIPTKRRIVRARDVEFDETQFYSSGEAPFPIRILDDSYETIATLDESASTRILDEIDIPESPNLPTTPSLDPGQPGQGGDSSSSIDQLDHVLGDAPLTPPNDSLPCSPSSSSSDSGQPTPSQQEPRTTAMLQPMVLIDNTDFDASGYEPLFATTPLIGKRSRSETPDDLSDSDEKRPRVNLTAFHQAFAAYQSLPGKLAISAIPPSPSDYNDLREHPFRKEFIQAMEVEFNKLLQMNTFEPTSAKDIQKDHSRIYSISNQKHYPIY